MWELDCEESWALKNWCFWTVVLEKTLESPLDCKEIQPVHSKGDQSWVFFGRNDAKAETLVLWPPHGKSWLIGKDSDAGRDWGQEEKRMTEDEMAGWHRWLDGREFEWTPGDELREAWHAAIHGLSKSQTWQSDWTEPEVGHSFPSKEQASFNFMAIVTICSDFRAQENKICHCFHCFPNYMPLSDRTRYHDLSFLNVEF